MTNRIESFNSFDGVSNNPPLKKNPLQKVTIRSDKQKPKETISHIKGRDNLDGTYSDIDKNDDGIGVVYTRETRYIKTKGGQQKTLSVAFTRSEYYGLSSYRRYLDKDGDGYADTVVSIDGNDKEVENPIDKSKFSKDSLKMDTLQDIMDPNLVSANSGNEIKLQQNDKTNQAGETGTLLDGEVSWNNDATPAEKTEQFKDELTSKIMKFSKSKKARDKETCQLYVNKLVELIQINNGVEKNNLKCNGTPEENEIFKKRKNEIKFNILQYAQFLGITVENKTGLYQLKIGNETLSVPERMVEIKEVPIEGVNGKGKEPNPVITD